MDGGFAVSGAGSVVRAEGAWARADIANRSVAGMSELQILEPFIVRLCQRDWICKSRYHFRSSLKVLTMVGGGMSRMKPTRRDFLRGAGVAASVAMLASSTKWNPALGEAANWGHFSDQAADHTLTIAVKPVELAPDRIVSVTTYNGQF